VTRAGEERKRQTDNDSAQSCCCCLCIGRSVASSRVSGEHSQVRRWHPTGMHYIRNGLIPWGSREGSIKSLKKEKMIQESHQQGPSRPKLSYDRRCSHGTVARAISLSWHGSVGCASTSPRLAAPVRVRTDRLDVILLHPTLSVLLLYNANAMTPLFTRALIISLRGAFKPSCGTWHKRQRT
jgi:hypothetical protein